MVRDDLRVQIMTDDDPYFWHRQDGGQYGACRLSLGRPGCACVMASSFTSRPRRCSSRSLAHFDLYIGGAGKVWTVHELALFLSFLGG